MGKRLNEGKIASSGLSSVIGKPFSAASCLVFLFLEGPAAPTGKGTSMPSIRRQNERSADKNDFRVVRRMATPTRGGRPDSMDNPPPIKKLASRRRGSSLA